MYVKSQDEVVVARHDRNDRSNESGVRNKTYLQKGNGAGRMALNGSEKGELLRGRWKRSNRWKGGSGNGLGWKVMRSGEVETQGGVGGKSWI